MTRLLLALCLFFIDNGRSSPPINMFGEVRYLMRVVNVTAFGPSMESILMDEKWTRKGIDQVFSAKLKNIRTFVASHMLVHFERCRDLGLACEDFQTWNFSQFLACKMLTMKNFAMSSIVKSVRPKTFIQTCPKINQGIYTIENATFDTDVIFKFYDDAANHYWKVHGLTYNLKNEIELQSHMQVFFIKYTKRNLSN